MKKRLILEILGSLIFVFASTAFVYGRLAGVGSFWNAQFLWNIVLAAGWIIVASGYYHQGWLVHVRKKTDEVSIVLPTAVFFVQCILFVKGIYYRDWALILGAVVVNSGVVFSLYQIMKVRRGKHG